MTGRYLQGETNHCPGCGRSQWHVGRITAECAFCSTPMPLADSSSRPSTRVSFGKGGGKVSRMAFA